MNKVNSLSIWLPWPPSVNNYFPVVGGRHIKSAKGRSYCAAVTALCAANRLAGTFPTQRVQVAILASPPNLARRDLDNLLKPILDALTAAQVWGDDSQVDELAIRRGPVVKDGLVNVRITTMEGGDHAA